MSKHSLRKKEARFIKSADVWLVFHKCLIRQLKLWGEINEFDVPSVWADSFEEVWRAFSDSCAKDG